MLLVDRYLVLVPLAAAGLLLVESSEGAIAGVATPNVDGSFTYSYTVSNTGSFPIFAWSLEFEFEETLRDWIPDDVGAGGDVLTNTGAPGDPFDDWVAQSSIPLTGMFNQDFQAIDPLGSGDVLPGGMLGGFEFTSFRRPGTVTFFEFGPSGQSASGSVVGPVPEPSGTIFLATSCLLWFGRRNRC